VCASKGWISALPQPGLWVVTQTAGNVSIGSASHRPVNTTLYCVVLTGLWGVALSIDTFPAVCVTTHKPGRGRHLFLVTLWWSCSKIVEENKGLGSAKALMRNENSAINDVREENATFFYFRSEYWHIRDDYASFVSQSLAICRTDLVANFLDRSLGPRRYNNSVRLSVRPSVRLSVCLSVIHVKRKLVVELLSAF